MKYLVIILGVIFSFTLIFSAMSLEPPRTGELEKYKNDGSYKDRLSFAKSLGNDKFDPALIKHKKEQMEATASGEISNTSVPPNDIAGLPSSGTPRIFVLLVEFPDYPHYNAPTVFASKLFGDGDSTELPYESLRNYYTRSSYNNTLTITGGSADVYGWYMAQKNRADYGTDRIIASRAVIKEALAYYDDDPYGPNVDFSPYDNDNDGDIDYFCVFWTGPNSGWATLWWGWYDRDFGDNSFILDKGTLHPTVLRSFSWQWESMPVNTVFKPTTVIHETGHALGLRDYYDYDGTVGPDGGVGGLDMMDGNWGDHNCFSKWLLGWVTPEIINESNAANKTLRDSARNRDCVAVMPGLTPTGMFGEYFMVQNRSRFGNDSKYPTDGLIIWHIDATLDTTDPENPVFKWNNSYTEHKLLRPMEADGREEIEKGFNADARDFYDGADVFSPTSKPNSNGYDPNNPGSASIYTGVTVNNISAGGATMTAYIKVGTRPVVTYYAINGGVESTTTRTVTLDNTTTGSPTQYMASESSTFKGAKWNTYSSTPPFTLSTQYGLKTVWFKVKSASGEESAPVSDSISYNKPAAAPMETFVTAAQDPFPNPCNPDVWIPFTLSKAEYVIIKIYSANGLLIRTLDLGQKLPGNYLASEKATYWNGRNEAGERVASGIYFYSIQAGDFTDTKKLVIAK